MLLVAFFGSECKRQRRRIETVDVDCVALFFSVLVTVQGGTVAHTIRSAARLLGRAVKSSLLATVAGRKLRVTAGIECEDGVGRVKVSVAIPIAVEALLSGNGSAPKFPHRDHCNSCGEFAAWIECLASPVPAIVAFGTT